MYYTILLFIIYWYYVSKHMIMHNAEILFHFKLIMFSLSKSIHEYKL